MDKAENPNEKTARNRRTSGWRWNPFPHPTPKSPPHRMRS